MLFPRVCKFYTPTPPLLVTKFWVVIQEICDLSGVGFRPSYKTKIYFLWESRRVKGKNREI